LGGVLALRFVVALPLFFAAFFLRTVFVCVVSLDFRGDRSRVVTDGVGTVALFLMRDMVGAVCRREVVCLFWGRENLKNNILEI
jgi:hypothetical protein